jgi:hypothetical protein
MKNFAINFLKGFFEQLFSFSTVAFVIIMAVIYLLIVTDNLSEAESKACYKAGMVKVRTDGGRFCVTPANLVEMK